MPVLWKMRKFAPKIHLFVSDKFKYPLTNFLFFRKEKE